MPFGNKAKNVIPLVHFGATEKRTVHNHGNEHNELINEIVLASYDNLTKGILGYSLSEVLPAG